MEFSIQRKDHENLYKFPTEDVKLASRFEQELRKELKDFIISVVVFGSVARKSTTKYSDIDILVISDDCSYVLTEALIETYKIIVTGLIKKICPRFHVTSMTFSSFWQQVHNGDPVVVNMLREGYALYDPGFFEPMQRLLKMGKIRPTNESVWRYFGRAPKTLLNSRWHVLQATLDLYWAVIDSAHAALMRANQVPPTPDHVASMLDKVFVKSRILEKKYVETMQKFFKLSKDITHRKIQEVTGEQYERLYKEADLFVRRMKKIVQRQM
jgi:predicted nucleotidyltransferase/uncharacterized protein (UPF0332 family)